jgi:predicted DCC family thiol-disulfide oxidoreductase YuxK
MERAVVLYDGNCGLCHAGVRFMLAHEAGDQFLFAPLSSACGEQLRRRHDVAGPGNLSVIVIEAGRAWQRSAAVARIARRLRWPWRLGQWLVMLPRDLADSLYDIVARHRHRCFRRPACVLPTGPWAGKFLG